MCVKIVLVEIYILEVIFLACQPQRTIMTTLIFRHINFDSIHFFTSLFSHQHLGLLLFRQSLLSTALFECMAPQWYIRLCYCTKRWYALLCTLHSQKVYFAVRTSTSSFVMCTCKGFASKVVDVWGRNYYVVNIDIIFQVFMLDPSLSYVFFDILIRFWILFLFIVKERGLGTLNLGGTAWSNMGLILASHIWGYFARHSPSTSWRITD